MNVKPITVDYLPIFENNYIWLIMNPTRDKVIAVDPGDASPLIDYLNLNDQQMQDMSDYDLAIFIRDRYLIYMNHKR